MLAGSGTAAAVRLAVNSTFFVSDVPRPVILTVTTEVRLYGLTPPGTLPATLTAAPPIGILPVLPVVGPLSVEEGIRLGKIPLCVNGTRRT